MRVQRHKLVVVALFAGLAIYIGAVWVPTVIDLRLVGFAGSFEAGGFVVGEVTPGSAAARAGLVPGDVVTAAGNRSTQEWHDLYAEDFGDYLNRRSDWRDRSLTLLVQRDARPLELQLTPTDLGFTQFVRLYGIRALFVIFLAVLAMFIVMSNPRDPVAFLVCLNFVFAGLWLFSGQRFWPDFFSPLLPEFPTTRVYVTQCVEIVAIQLTISCLLHVALVFPGRQIVRGVPRWVRPLVYLLPVGILGAIMAFAAGSVTQRMATIYPPRLWINLFMLVLATLVLVHSYLTRQSPKEREQTRWFVVAMAVSTSAFVGLWILPRLLLGHGLVPDFDWLLFPLALIPASLAVSIANHELFGIRGIIRRRIKLLQSLLERERTVVLRRDSRIGELTREIKQLKTELDQYAAAEMPRAGERSLPGLGRLEKQYPELTRIRAERLIGASPLWERVFEDAVLASRGSAPVLIVGESGTGKTDGARAIHQLSGRRDRPYRAVSCAQFEHADPAIALGRLFGIGRSHGLANVPREGQRGLLEECDGGTLFLDDFDRLPINVQDLLLYPLEGKAFEPGIGAGPTVKVDVKFILATNREPEALVEQGLLRGDVLARIGGRVEIPPLRQRREDIPLLVEHFVKECSREIGHQVDLVSPRALNLLSRYDYARGNARELRAEVFKAIGKAALEDDQVLRAGYLADRLQLPQGAGPRMPEPHAEPERSATAAAPQQRASRGELDELEVLRRHRFRIKPAESELGLSHKSRTLSNHLRGMCIQALADNGWNVDEAARALVGEDDAYVIAKVRAKIQRFVRNIDSHVASHSEAKLLNNLPTPYVEALGKAVAWSRDRLSADVTGLADRPSK